MNEPSPEQDAFDAMAAAAEAGALPPVHAAIGHETSIEKGKEDLPPLMADWSFWGMTVTGFLGCMNDNIYQNLLKFLVLSMAVAAGQNAGQKVAAVNDGQWLPMLLLGVPFVFLSGFAGMLSDRNSKQVVVFWSKIAEVVFMLVGLLAFWLVPWIGSSLCMVVMFLMAAQSAFYGPAKYGILPEMLREDDMPQATGITLMATFVSIILGTVLGGVLFKTFQDNLVLAQAFCVAIAIVGTLTTFPIRRDPPAQPDLEFRWSDWAVPQDTWELMFRDIALWWAVLASCIFWSTGSIVQATVMSFGNLQLKLNADVTGLMAGILAIGIAVGSVVSGMFKDRAAESRLVTGGAWGIALLLVALAGLGHTLPTVEIDKAQALKAWHAAAAAAPAAMPMPADLAEIEATQSRGYWSALGLLFPLGIATGVFVVPIQVFLQARPPDEQKGRMIACQAFCNWVTISASALLYFGLEWIIHWCGWPRSAMFAITALLVVPIAILYRLPLEKERPE